DRVAAQEARRAMDRVVGFPLSNLLGKKVAGGLSAGRVQSVAVKLIVDREREIEAFKTEEYWKITALLAAQGTRVTWGADPKMPNEAAADQVVAALQGVPFVVTKREEKERQDRPRPPFTTSTLQQQANILMRFPTSRTMQTAQKLYEGVELEGLGQTAL